MNSTSRGCARATHDESGALKYVFGVAAWSEIRVEKCATVVVSQRQSQVISTSFCRQELATILRARLFNQIEVSESLSGGGLDYWPTYNRVAMEFPQAVLS